VASVAVVVNAECDLPVMAFPAEVTLLDGLHGFDRRPFFFFWSHLPVVAVITFQASFQMLVSMKDCLV